MKRLLLLGMVVLAAGYIYGQRAMSEGIMMPKQQVVTAKVPTDTLLPGNWEYSTSYALYTAQGGGYVAGVNGYGDFAKGQQFLVDVPYNIEGVMIWFGAKELVSPDGALKFMIWDLDGTTGHTMAGANQPCPGTVLNSDNVLMSLIDTGSFLADAYIHMFTNTT